MSRTDLFTTFHKGIRTLLFETAARAGRCAFDDTAEAAAIAADLRALLGWVSEHSACEDAVVLPELRRLAPDLWSEVHSEHARIGGMQAELAALLERLAKVTGAERCALGRRLQRRLHGLVAAKLRHMEREEVEVNRVLWAHCSEAELLAVRARIASRLTPARAAEWLAVLLPACARGERKELVGWLRQSMPAWAFGAITAPARTALGVRRPAVRAPVPAVDRRREQAALDLAAAGHLDRRERRRASACARSSSTRTTTACSSTASTWCATCPA